MKEVLKSYGYDDYAIGFFLENHYSKREFSDSLELFQEDSAGVRDFKTIVWDGGYEGL